MNLSKLTKTAKVIISKTGRLVLIAAAATAVVGCAGLASSAPPEQVVRQLATQRWQALLAGDFDKAYEFATPSYRQIKSAGTYRLQKQAQLVKWISAEVVGAKCDGPKCDLFYKLEFKPMVPMRFDGTLFSGNSEVWVFEGGQWWAFEDL